jgi:hypothetical protein
MMGYLTNLADVIRRAGLNVIEEPGWQTRARSSGAYANGRPTHVMVHHTASNPSTDGQADVNYMCYNSGDRPIANLYLDRSGTVWVLAAGATNTNGKGADTWGGGVPNDKMNEYAIGIEGANNGVGEPWPKVQTDAYVKLVATLCAQYNIPVGHVRAHAEWAPTRKIDPAGPSPWAAGSNTWDMDAFRGSVLLGGAPNPDPPSQGVPDMFVPVKPYRNSDTRPFGGPAAPGDHVFGLDPAKIPANVTAVALNVTAVDATEPGFVTVWPGGSRPSTSCVNYKGDRGSSSAGIVVGTSGRNFSIYNHTRCHLIVDVTGYWVP